jgi:hypothetical protein
LIKKLILTLVVSAAIIASLHFFGGRDFSQTSLAWKKYQNSSDFSQLASDIGLIFQGERVKDSLIPAEEINKTFYRWTDENGQVQYGDRVPVDINDYEVVSVKDLPFNMQESMTDEEIQEALSQ